MLLGKVTGSVWLNQQAPGIEGVRLVRVRHLKADGSWGAETLAADNMDAHPGEWVLVGSSSRVRDVVFSPALAAKAVVIAIVDQGDVDFDARGKIWASESDRCRLRDRAPAGGRR